MAFFIGLLIFYGLMWLLSLVFPALLPGAVTYGSFAAAIMFMLVGLSHFLKREKLLEMIPERWPYRVAMNYISGALEIILGMGLLSSATRFYAACGLILLLVAVFPANIYVAWRRRSFYSVSRLFFQPVYIAWIWCFCLRG